MTMEKLADVNEIAPGHSLIVRDSTGREIALFNIEGKIFALNNLCPHRGGPLGEGELDGCIVTCPWHSWQFDVRTGACENMPGEDAETIPIFINEGRIYLL